MWRTLAATCAVLLIAFLVSAQDTKTASKPNASAPIYAIPAEDARKENPVQASPESLARGKKQYGYDCVMCHGKEGNGKGEVAADMKLKMNDESDPALLKGRTDGELFYIIKKGKDQMPPEGARVKDETIWDMVNYVRSFAKKSASDQPADEKTPN
jgi:mono/diheme cytochrome c family protein